MNPKRYIPHLLALMCVLIWGVSFINTKVLLERELSSVEIIIYRFVITYIGLLALSRFRVRFFGWKDEALMALGGLTGGAIYFIAQNVALELTLVSDVAVLIAVNPLLTILLAAIILRDERFTRLKFLGSLVAFAGVGLLTFHDGFVWGNGVIGDLLALLAAFSWAVYSILLKRLNNKYTSLEISRKTFFYGLLTAIPFVLREGTFSPVGVLKDPVVIFNLVFLAVMCGMVAFIFWGMVTKHIGAIQANNYLYLDPVVSMVAAYLYYGETVGAVGLAGCVLILSGIIIVQRQQLPQVAQ